MSKAAQNSTPQRNPLAAAPQLRAALGAWYRAHRRRLPWREQPSLYKTVVSEFMLQQTQVETVLPYFDRWLKKFPGFKALAAAREADVLKLWEGLGYYRRARLLHALAREFVKLPTPPRRQEAHGSISPCLASAPTPPPPSPASLSMPPPPSWMATSCASCCLRLLGSDSTAPSSKAAQPPSKPSPPPPTHSSTPPIPATITRR